MTAPLFFRVDVTVVEDLHAGTGTGSEDVDALLARDRYGRPVVRSSHFKGLLREAGNELVKHSALNQQNLTRLLGDPGRGALQLTSLRLSEGGGSLVWFSTARQKEGRAPLHDTLRAVEHVAAGTSFNAELRLADPACRDLLARLVRRMDRVGGDRNRGSGLVTARISPCSPPRTHAVPEKPSGLRLRLLFRNLEPLCLPATGHPGNLIYTQSFIRGQALRGALMAWSFRGGRDPGLDGVSVGDALPLPPGIEQADTILPLPLSIMAEKPVGNSPALPWWAQAPHGPARFDGFADRTRDGGEKPKRPDPHEYVCRLDADARWLCYTPELKVHLRNKKAGKKPEEDADLFSTEEIAEDTLFQAELVFEDESSAARFLKTYAPVLSGADWLAVGRGGRPVAVAQAVEFLAAPVIAAPGDAWTLTLTSDLVLRGPNLGFLDNLGIETLAGFAGVPANPGWRIKEAFVETEPLHGFNAASGLPRAPALSIRRGSCWCIEGPGSGTMAKTLATKAALGERTHEGCGRFAVGLQPLDRIEAPRGADQEVRSNGRETLRATAARLTRGIDMQKQPSLSQLQWLRARALAAGDQATIEKLLETIESAPKFRPRSAEPWNHFPVAELRQQTSGLSPEEQRLLISYLVETIAARRLPRQQTESRW
jgi:hypothetical protein